MIRVIISMAILLLSARFGQADPTVVTLKKAQLGALSAAIHQMQEIGRVEALRKPRLTPYSF